MKSLLLQFLLQHSQHVFSLVHGSRSFVVDTGFRSPFGRIFRTLLTFLEMSLNMKQGKHVINFFLATFCQVITFKDSNLA